MAQIRQVLEARPEVRLAVLFGSPARGGARPRSDLDLGLELLGEAPGHSRRRHDEIAFAVQRATGRVVDVVDLVEASPLLRFEIARDGVVLVEGEPHAWADFKARAMLDWWDFAPLARRIHEAAIARLQESAVDGAS
ncbi:MAG TPA: nucleotidyltransferase domain-containing protein [Thermoanaerobaculia bacterium]|nr:nucleotidyltransferase domain-containing protein [Thermoanaerobaculia bacterium]